MGGLVLLLSLIPRERIAFRCNRKNNKHKCLMFSTFLYLYFNLHYNAVAKVYQIFFIYKYYFDFAWNASPYFFGHNYLLFICLHLCNLIFWRNNLDYFLSRFLNHSQAKLSWITFLYWDGFYFEIPVLRAMADHLDGTTPTSDAQERCLLARIMWAPCSM